MTAHLKEANPALAAEMLPTTSAQLSKSGREAGQHERLLPERPDLGWRTFATVIAPATMRAAQSPGRREGGPAEPDLASAVGIRRIGNRGLPMRRCVPGG
jgi:hypothetical protein